MSFNEGNELLWGKWGGRSFENSAKLRKEWRTTSKTNLSGWIWNLKFWLIFFMVHEFFACLQYFSNFFQTSSSNAFQISSFQPQHFKPFFLFFIQIAILTGFTAIKFEDRKQTPSCAKCLGIFSVFLRVTLKCSWSTFLATPAINRNRRKRKVCPQSQSLKKFNLFSLLEIIASIIIVFFFWATHKMFPNLLRCTKKGHEIEFA